MVRQGSIFKVVGWDISMSVEEGAIFDPQSNATGSVSWISPSKGRCDAWRHAFYATQKWRKAQGVPPNYNYDFRLGFDAASEREDTFGDSPTANQAWLEYYSDDDEESSYQGLFLMNSAAAESQQSIFDVYNLGIEHRDGTDVPTFGSGWQPYNPFESGEDRHEMDFVKNEQSLLVTNPRGPQYASLTRDFVGFQVSYTMDDDKGTTTVPYQYRPVAREYVPVMCGLLQVSVLDTMQQQGDVNLELSFYVAGWTSLLKRRGSRKGRK